MDRLAWHARNSPKIESSDGSRTAGKSKVELFVIIELHLGCCSSPRSASGISNISRPN